MNNLKGIVSEYINEYLSTNINVGDYVKCVRQIYFGVREDITPGKIYEVLNKTSDANYYRFTIINDSGDEVSVWTDMFTTFKDAL